MVVVVCNHGTAPEIRSRFLIELCVIMFTLQLVVILWRL